MISDLIFSVDTSRLKDVPEPSAYQMAYEERGILVGQFKKALGVVLKQSRNYQAICLEIVILAGQRTGEIGDSSTEALFAIGMGDYAAVVEESANRMDNIGEEMARVSVDKYIEIVEERIRQIAADLDIQPMTIEGATANLEEINSELHKRWLAFLALDDIEEAMVEEAIQRADQ